jgi:uncharacterized protein YhhL (DUF1145 family)
MNIATLVKRLVDGGGIGMVGLTAAFKSAAARQDVDDAPLFLFGILHLRTEG